MKTMFFMLFSMFLTLNLTAQVQFSVQIVDPTDVPQVILETQSNYFSGLAVNVWEKQTGSVRAKSGLRYVANFQKSGQKTRARYYENGKAISATSYYAAKELPQAIQSAATTNHAGYRLNSGEEIILLNKQKSFFRLRLRKGAQKLVIYVDKNGKELSKNSIPEDVIEDELTE